MVNRILRDDALINDKFLFKNVVLSKVTRKPVPSELMWIMPIVNKLEGISNDLLDNLFHLGVRRIKLNNKYVYQMPKKAHGELFKEQLFITINRMQMKNNDSQQKTMQSKNKSEYEISRKKSRKFEITQSYEEVPDGIIQGNLFFENCDQRNSRARINSIVNKFKTYSLEEMESILDLNSSTLNLIAIRNKEYILIPRNLTIDQINLPSKVVTPTLLERTEIEVNINIEPTLHKPVINEQSDSENGISLSDIEWIEKQKFIALKQEIKEISKDVNHLGEKVPDKAERTVRITKRNRTLVGHLKQLYLDYCQLCNHRVEIGYQEFISHVHHIKPLGSPHDGPDLAENAILLCPYCHSMFDNGAITIDLTIGKVIHVNSLNAINDNKIKLKHNINIDYINYHNKEIYKGTIQVDNRHICESCGSTIRMGSYCKCT
ncbi:HNH endonuclease [Brevibacillus centrosporus]|uniref:HNH endonuclease n=1 Tax=Brevibacillus centrosporus TaxID=54910 RepID=UPI003D1C7E72